MLQIHVQSKRYPAVGQAEARLVIEDLRLQVPTGQFVCLFGPSGCGKTTLLNIVAGLDTEFDGAVRWLDDAGHIADPHIGYVFQEPRLLPWRTVQENIELASPVENVDRDWIDDLLQVMELGEARHVYPERLSVGMSRRVAVARAFSIKPALLLMDEPFVSLDEATAIRIRALLLEVWRRQPTTVLFVTHDLREAIMLADRIVFLSSDSSELLLDHAVDIPRERRNDALELEAYRRGLLATVYHDQLGAAGY